MSSGSSGSYYRMTSSAFTIRVPASTANLGPGFDTLGLALNLYLNVHVTRHSQTDQSTATSKSRYPQVSIAYVDKQLTVSLVPEENLLTKVCIHVLEAFNIPVPSMYINVSNDIPFGSGLGSSGSAIVGGVMLANQVGNLKLTKDQMLPFCLDFEGHPDVRSFIVINARM